jgi:hypothetical protein
MAMHPHIIAVIADLLDRGVAEGVFRESVVAVSLFITILGLSVIGISNRYTLSAVFGRDLAGVDEAKTWRAHVIDVILRLLAPIPSP